MGTSNYFALSKYMWILAKNICFFLLKSSSKKDDIEQMHYKYNGCFPSVMLNIFKKAWVGWFVFIWHGWIGPWAWSGRGARVRCAENERYRAGGWDSVPPVPHHLPPLPRLLIQPGDCRASGSTGRTGDTSWRIPATLTHSATVQCTLLERCTGIWYVFGNFKES